MLNDINYRPSRSGPHFTQYFEDITLQYYSRMGLQKWLLVSTLCFLLLAVDVHQFRNLFESTLDTDGDGHFGIEDWVDHFNIL
jgi:hypothetical protein